MSTSTRFATYAAASAFAALLPTAALAQEVADEPMPAPAPAEVAPAPAAPMPVEEVPVMAGTWIAPGPTVAPAPAVDPNLDQGQVQDSNIDRSFLMPTAQTQPGGSVTFNDYELLFMGVTYGVTDDLQLTGMTMVPLGEDAPWIGILAAKFRLLHVGRARLAAQGSVTFLGEPRSEDSDSATEHIFTAGGVASYCLDEGCNSLASLSATTAIGPNGETTAAFVYGASLIQRLNRRTKLMLEYVSAMAKDDAAGWTSLDGGLLSYGIRFYSSEISGDIGFIKPVGEDVHGSDDEMPMGVPFINFTYRAM